MKNTAIPWRQSILPQLLAPLGAILSVAGLAFFIPLFVIPFMPAEVKFLPQYVFPGSLLILIGLAFTRLEPQALGTLSLNEREGCLVIVVAWLLASLAATWPIMASTDLDFTRCFFESVSGWTTTGLSVIDVEAAPRSLLLFRSSLQLVGGAGLAIIMLAVFSMPVGAGLYRAEGRPYQLVPNVAHSAKLVLRLYAGYCIVGVFALWASGMSFFDAVNHAFAAISTGGFSTRTQSIGHWDSPAVEAVTIVLMILGNLNFLTAYVLFSGKLHWFAKNSEVRVLGILVPASAALLFILVTRGAYGGLTKELRVAVFETITAITTTGFSTVGYRGWNVPAFLVLLFLMLVGGGTCSTAGGIKQFRFSLLLSATKWEVRRILLPRRAILARKMTVGDEELSIEARQVMEAGIFVFLYFLTFGLGTFILTLQGYSLRDSLFEFASVLGTVGLSAGVTSARCSNFVLWTETIGMLLGRLEFFVVFAAVAHSAHMIARPGKVRRRAC